MSFSLSHSCRIAFVHMIQSQPRLYHAQGAMYEIMCIRKAVWLRNVSEHISLRQKTNCSLDIFSPGIPSDRPISPTLRHRDQLSGEASIVHVVSRTPQVDQGHNKSRGSVECRKQYCPPQCRGHKVFRGSRRFLDSHRTTSRIAVPVKP